MMDQNQNKMTGEQDGVDNLGLLLDDKILALRNRQAIIEKEYMRMKKEFDEKAARDPAILDKEEGRCPFGFGKDFKHQEQLIKEKMETRKLSDGGISEQPQSNEASTNSQNKDLMTKERDDMPYDGGISEQPKSNEASTNNQMQDLMTKECDDMPYMNTITGQLYTSMLQWNQESRQNPQMTLSDLWKQQGGSVSAFVKKERTTRQLSKDQNVFALKSRQAQIEKDYMKMKSECEQNIFDSPGMTLMNMEKNQINQMMIEQMARTTDQSEQNSCPMFRHKDQGLTNITASPNTTQECPMFQHTDQSFTYLNANQNKMSSCTDSQLKNTEDTNLVLKQDGNSFDRRSVDQNEQNSCPMLRHKDQAPAKCTASPNTTQPCPVFQKTDQGFAQLNANQNKMSSCTSFQFQNTEDVKLHSKQDENSPTMRNSLAFSKCPYSKMFGSTLDTTNLFEIKQRMKADGDIRRLQQFQKMKMICKMTGKFTTTATEAT